MKRRKARTRRNKQGQYAMTWWNHFKPLLSLILFTLLMWIIQQYFKEKEMISPCPESGCRFEFQVRAYEEPEIVNEPKSIEQMILDTFAEDGELMVRIFTCESGLDPEQIGDKHLMGWSDGEYLGDSIGIAQIRTGDAGIYDTKPWNRAKANGMTVEEFRAWLKVPENNIKYAKDIYERQGVFAWYNCYQKVK